MNLKLKDEIISVLSHTLFSLYERINNERLYAVAIYTDSSFMTLGVAANSEEGFNEAIAQQDDDSYATSCYYRWAFSEWKYDAWMTEEFKSISKYLRESPSRKNFNAFSQEVIESIVSAVSEVKQKLPERSEDEITFFISITDDDLSEELENSSAKLLNNDIIYNKFINRYNF